MGAFALLFTNSILYIINYEFPSFFRLRLCCIRRTMFIVYHMLLICPTHLFLYIYFFLSSQAVFNVINQHSGKVALKLLWHQDIVKKKKKDEERVLIRFISAEVEVKSETGWCNLHHNKVSTFISSALPKLRKITCMLTWPAI